ncbi:hypothetical protein ACS0TY_029277 [Phlomoides rotata]
MKNPMQEPMRRPQLSRGSFENVRLGGRNVGASMVAGGGDSPGSCSINIYINNDVQGINNSVLIDSEVRMGDPGISFCLEGLKMDRGFRMVTKKKDNYFLTTLILLLLAFVILIISFFAHVLV